MATYSEIQTRVTRRVIDLPAAVLAEVPKLINEAMKKLQNKHNFKVMETLGGPYLTTVDTNTLTAVPSNFKEFRGLPYYLSAYGQARDITVAANRQAVLDRYTLDDLSFPQVLLESEPTDTGSLNWEVFPLANGYSDWDDGEYRVCVPYYRYLPELSANGDTNWFTVNAEEYLVNLATSEAFALDWDMENMTLWLQKASAEQTLVINTDKKKVLSSVKTLVPLWQGVNQPNLRS